MTREIIGIAAIFAELKQSFVEWDAKLERLQKMLHAERLPLDPPARTGAVALMLEPGTSRAYHPIPWGLPCCLW
jgi:hypothetical protein